MAKYEDVSKALERGVTPEQLCMTCPWDRYCVNPPEMTKSEIDKKLKEALDKDEERVQGDHSKGMPITSLMTAIVLGGKDHSANICPVFALRLRDTHGRELVDGIKATMQGWVES
jgi:hypothetical protein